MRVNTDGTMSFPGDSVFHLGADTYVYSLEDQLMIRYQGDKSLLWEWEGARDNVKVSMSNYGTVGPCDIETNCTTLDSFSAVEVSPSPTPES